jgi:hypothetical protein
MFCFSRLEETINHFENKRICLKMAELLLENNADVNTILDIEKGHTLLMIFCAVKYKLE